jgi:hypothetical protein
MLRGCLAFFIADILWGGCVRFSDTSPGKGGFDILGIWFFGEIVMPTISMFYGIIVALFYEDNDRHH